MQSEILTKIYFIFFLIFVYQMNFQINQVQCICLWLIIHLFI